MPSLRLLAVVAAGLSLATPATVSAQDWLGRLARSAAQGAAARAITGAAEAAARGNSAPAPAPAPSPTAPATRAAAPTQAPAVSALPADLPAPRPVNYSPSLQGPTMMEFSEADKAAKKAFEDASAVRCSDCEGGRAYENWVRHERSELFSPNVLENRLGGMAVGEAIRWRGSTSGTRFALTVVDTRSIGSWECRQLRWSAERAQASERPGLICKMPSGNWREIF